MKTLRGWYAYCVHDNPAILIANSSMVLVVGVLLALGLLEGQSLVKAAVSTIEHIGRFVDLQGHIYDQLAESLKKQLAELN